MLILMRGDNNIEKQYRIHYISTILSQQKQQRLIDKEVILRILT